MCCWLSLEEVIPSSVENGSPLGRQLSNQQHLAVESLHERQLREQGGDELVHLDEEELHEVRWL